MWWIAAVILLERDDLAFEITAMAMADQEMRTRMSRMYPQFKGMGPRQFDEWQQVDTHNTERMKQIIKQIGWPDSQKVGPKASGDAWLLVQHADQDPKFQKLCLQLLEPGLKKGTVAKRDYAYLYDRVACAEDRPQRYGTQYILKNGKWSMKPTEDPKNLDKRRRAMGLGPIKEYEKLLREVYK